MIKAMFDCENMDFSELEQFAKEQEHYITTEVKEIIKQGEILKERIDGHLQRGEVKEAAELTDTKTYIEAAQWSMELEYFERVCRIKKYGLMCKGKSVEEIARIYQKTVFYLRRVEFEFEREYLNEFFEFVKTKELPCEYLITVLEHNEISDDFAVGYRLADTFLAEGNVEYARLVISWLEQRQKACEERENG